MNIKEIREVINNNSLPDDVKKHLILDILAGDENVIPDLLKILHAQFNENKAVLTSSNLELSKALVLLQTKGELPKSKSVIRDIKNHYIAWQHKIKCCFKIKGLP